MTKVWDDKSAEFEIFPWRENFATGIALIDEQHQQLVSLLNKLARHFISGTTADEDVESITNDLAAYANYHFRSEEDIWHRHFLGHPLLTAHEAAHHEFFEKVESIRRSKSKLEDFVEDLFGFLTRWLAFHILDNDRRMAIATLQLDKGSTMESALSFAEKEMSGTLSVLINALLELYGELSASTVEIMRQRIARQRAEEQAFESLRLLAAKELSHSEERYKMLFEAIPDCVLVIDLPAGHIVDANKVAESLTGYPIETLKKLFFYDIHPASDREFHIQNLARLAGLAENGISDERFETIVVNANGSLIDVEICVRGPFHRENNIYLVGVVRDITERKRHQQDLERVAYYDELTGLLNRNGIKRYLDSLIRKRDKDALILHADLDNFTRINEHHGIETADRLLSAFARLMQTAIPTGALASRLGGDEFLLVIENPPPRSEIQTFVATLMNALQKPVILEETSIALTLCLGVNCYDHTQQSSSEQQLRQVAHALYIAKLSGKSQFHILDQAQEDAERNRHRMLNRIEQGLRAQEFELFFQPKVNMLTGTVTGAEALIRWHHPEQGLLGPGQFIPLTTHYPVSACIDRWVLRDAFRQLQAWTTRYPDLVLSINISAASIQDPAFTASLRALLEEHREVSPHRLQIEILESSAMMNMNVAIGTLNECRALGINIAIDDFGTGYSSLSYLRRLPVDCLKLDQSFVADLDKDDADVAVIRGIIGMSQSFGLAIIAEGVETLEQGRKLIKMGCVHGQGYAISRPLPAPEFDEWLQGWKTPRIWKEALHDPN